MGLGRWVAIAVLLVLGSCCGAGAWCWWDACGYWVCDGDEDYYCKPGSLAAEETACRFLAWQGSSNSYLVLDADDDVMRFEKDGPHLLGVGESTVLDLSASEDGRLLWRGVEVGAVSLARAEDGQAVAVLVDPDGFLYDLRREAEGVRLATTTERAPASGLPGGPTPSDGAACGRALAAGERSPLALRPEGPADEWTDLGAGDVLCFGVEALAR